MLLGNNEARLKAHLQRQSAEDLRDEVKLRLHRCVLLDQWAKLIINPDTAAEAESVEKEIDELSRLLPN